METTPETSRHDQRSRAPSGEPRAGAGEPRGRMLFRAFMSLDINGFGRHDPADLDHLHGALYEVAEDAFRAARLPWDCYRADRGDGLLAILPPDPSYEDLLPLFPAQLCARVTAHNDRVRTPLSVRLAVHAGFLRFNANGVVGGDVNYLFRLLEAPAFKAEFRERDATFGIIVSDFLYRKIVHGSPGVLLPGGFDRIEVDGKEVRGDAAWSWFPPPAPRGNVRPLRTAPDGSPRAL
ncbi:hypothetical protein ACSNOI_05330 [Actinomadura kijaniata]|uniref:hypothetical protein n=1 Tax=Actinomadura kijaniata TaxID=46161 RepID=UPI003F1A786A